jgi:hypothetical protein
LIWSHPRQGRKSGTARVPPLALATLALALTSCSVADLPSATPGSDGASDGASADDGPQADTDAGATAEGGDSGCPSLCGTANFGEGGLVNGAVMGVVGALSAPNALDGMLGLSQDGKVLHARAMATGQLDILLSVPSSTSDAGYDTVDLTVQASGDAGPPFSSRSTITFDGTALILTTPAGDAFRQAPLTGLTLGPVTVGPFGPINNSLPTGAVLLSPVISSDGLTFYFAIATAPSATPQGAYSASRFTTSDDFGVGVLLPVDIQAFWYPTGVAADGRTLFVERNFQSYTVSRCQPSDPWTVLSLFHDGGLGLPLTHYWEARPAADCSFMLTTCGPGGAPQQDICMLPRLP